MEQNAQVAAVSPARRLAEPAIAPDPRVLQRLRQTCRVMLERYVDVASLNSGNLSRLTPLSIDDLGRSNLALLKRKEEKAHQAYVAARDALLKHVLGEDEFPTN
jgi:hypothetical protein